MVSTIGFSSAVGTVTGYDFLCNPSTHNFQPTCLAEWAAEKTKHEALAVEIVLEATFARSRIPDAAIGPFGYLFAAGALVTANPTGVAAIIEDRSRKPVIETHTAKQAFTVLIR